MDSVARISFFIVLSLALHILSLPTDFMPTATSYKTELVGVDYISRPLESFYPVPDIQSDLLPLVGSPTQRVPQAVSTDAEQNKRVGREEEPKPTIDAIELTQKIVRAEPAMMAVKDSSSARIDEPVVNQSEVVAVAAPKIPQEVFNPPLLQVAEADEFSARDDFSSSYQLVQATSSASPQDQSAPLTGQKSSHLRQEFIDALPLYDVNPPPEYPEVAKLRGWEGRVVFEALILRSGRVGSLDVVASSGYQSLDRAARKAITRWRFRPATSFGLSIDSQVEIPVIFSLKEQKLKP